MPVYRYKSVAGTGEVVQGQLEADDRESVVSRLQQLGHVPLHIEPAAAGLSLDFLHRDVFGTGGVSAQNLTILTREIATLLGAGLPLDRALEIILKLDQGTAAHKLVGRVLDEIRAGRSLADALDKEGQTFPRYYVSMVRAGEAGASLEEVLARLADFMEPSRALSSSVKSALIYPIILLLTAGASVVVLLTFVVPTFVPLFEGAGTKLPLSTQIVIGAGTLFAQYWWALLAGLLLIFLAVRAHLAQPSGRLWWHSRLLKVPLLGSLWTKIDIARLCRTLGTLLSNGVDLLTALSLVKDVLSNAALVAAVERIEPDVKAGRGLADPLAETKLFPVLTVQLLGVGEESGHLETMLMKLADIYEQETNVAIQRMLALLVPVITLGLGALIAFIIASILLALFSINELVL